MPKHRPLTQKQQRFVQEYQIDWNATQAALRAGYSEKVIRGAKGAYHVTKSARVKMEIAKIQLANAEQVGVQTQNVVDGLYTEALGLGPDTTAAARVRAWAILGKHLGMFVDRHEHSGEVSRSVTVEFIGSEDNATKTSKPARLGAGEEQRQS